MWVTSGSPDLGQWWDTGRRENGGMIVGWLLRITLAIIVLGVFVFDVFSLAYTNVTTVDDAQIIAAAGADHLDHQRNDIKGAKRESEDKAAELGVDMSRSDWWLDTDSKVHVTVSRTAESLVLRYVGPLQRYLTVRAVGTAQVH